MREQAVPAQIALSWLMVQKPWIVPISGTTQMTHMVDKIGAAAIRFTPDEVAELNASVNQARLAGHASPPCWPYPRGSTTEEYRDEVIQLRIVKTRQGRGLKDDETYNSSSCCLHSRQPFVFCLGCSGAQQSAREMLSGCPTEKKILIVYLSRTNNTKAIAEIIHQKVGGSTGRSRTGNTLSR